MDQDLLPLQVVAASATVGRPLRRDLQRAIKQAMEGETGEKGGYSGQFSVLRASDGVNIGAGGAL